MTVINGKSCPHLFEKDEADKMRLWRAGDQPTGTSLAYSAGWCVTIENVYMNTLFRKTVVPR